MPTALSTSDVDVLFTVVRSRLGNEMRLRTTKFLPVLSAVRMLFCAPVVGGSEVDVAASVQQMGESPSSSRSRFLSQGVRGSLPPNASERLKELYPTYGVNLGNLFVPEDWLSHGWDENGCSEENPVPRDWGYTDFFPKTSFYCGLKPTPKDTGGTLRVTLSDIHNVNSLTRLERTAHHLDANINEDVFRFLSEQKVTAIRVPTGYWNWIQYPQGSTPDPGPHGDETQQREVLNKQAPRIVSKSSEEDHGGGDDRVASPAFNDAIGQDFKPILVEKFRNLQDMTAPGNRNPASAADDPSFYRAYLDRIFRYADKYNLRVLLDLHGVPGSANGEEHSGVMTDWEEKQKMYWQSSDWNFAKSLEAVEKMAEYMQEKEALYGSKVVYGVQIINEPQKPGEMSDEEHTRRLYAYYKAALDTVRTKVGYAALPVIVFAWTWQMDAFAHLMEADGGAGRRALAASSNVIWDTHLYHGYDGKEDSVEQALRDYDADLRAVRSFIFGGQDENENNYEDREQLAVVVGEWTMALRGSNMEGALAHDTASALVHSGFLEKASAMGHFYWTAQGPGFWGFQWSTQHGGIKWAEIFMKTHRAESGGILVENPRPVVEDSVNDDEQKRLVHSGRVDVDGGEKIRHQVERVNLPWRFRSIFRKDGKRVESDAPMSMYI